MKKDFIVKRVIDDPSGLITFKANLDELYCKLFGFEYNILQFDDNEKIYGDIYSDKVSISIKFKLDHLEDFHPLFKEFNNTEFMDSSLGDIDNGDSGYTIRNGVITIKSHFYNLDLTPYTGDIYFCISFTKED